MDRWAALGMLQLALVLQLPAPLDSAPSCVDKGEDVRCVVDQSAYSNKDVPTGAGSASQNSRKPISAHTTDHEYHWGYDEENGPLAWARAVPECGGSRQSPVALDTTLAAAGHHPRLHWFGWHNAPLKQVVANNGHTVSLTSAYASDKDVPLLWLSGSEQRYRLASLHFHWGGSEHTLNGERFSMEMHVVAFDNRFPSLAKAANQKNGLMVLGYFFRATQHASEALQLALVRHLAAVRRSNSSVTVAQPQRLSRLVRHFDKAFMLYPGSLTTPPCKQVVRWVLSKDVLSVSHQQEEQFMQLQNDRGKSLKKNWRPLQPLNGRAVTQIL